MSLSGKTILVAGAAGFVSSALCHFYLKKGAFVIGLDNLITGNRSNVPGPDSKNFEFIECDITDNLPDFRERTIDYIFSMASPASPVDFTPLFLEIMKVNSQGTWNLLDLAKQKKARILIASTSEVYGDPQRHPQKEDYVGHVNPIGTRACYDESKRFSESLAMGFHRRYGLETRIVRIFNTYGPRMRKKDGRVIPNFIGQVLAGEDLTVYGDGSQTRSFCYVSDLVSMIDGVMMGPDPMPINCGNPVEHTIKECAELIIKLTESKSRIVYRPLPEDDPKKRRPDIGKFQSICSFFPKISLEEGLKKTIGHFKTTYGDGGPEPCDHRREKDPKKQLIF